MRVLVAVDGSEPARLGVELVANAVWSPGTEVTAVVAAETGRGLFGGPWPALAMVQSERIEAEIVADAEAAVDDARRRLARPGLRVETAVLRGRPASAILDCARSRSVDLIVLGSRGHGRIATMLLGSVSAEVVDHSSAPVLVARGSQTARVVLAWDGSSGARRAADLVGSWPMFAWRAGRGSQRCRGWAAVVDRLAGGRQCRVIAAVRRVCGCHPPRA
jgi:nucleotide-binding universal stress UspA family protein